jgi:hypothetical protein
MIGTNEGDRKKGGEGGRKLYFKNMPDVRLLVTRQLSG